MKQYKGFKYVLPESILLMLLQFEPNFGAQHLSSADYGILYQHMQLFISTSFRMLELYFNRNSKYWFTILPSYSDSYKTPKFCSN